MEKSKNTGRRNSGKSPAGVVIRPFRRLAIKLITFAAAVCIAGTAAYFGWKKIRQVKISNTHALIERQLTKCQELVTVKNRYSDIVSIKKRTALGMAKSYSIIKYSGVVRAGISDITKASVKISSDGRKVTVLLPESVILGNEIFSQEVFDEHQNIFVPISTQEVFDSIDEARYEMTEEVMADGIIEDADRQAQDVVRTIMQTAGFADVVVKRQVQ